jgi:predicted ester cyclase
MKGMTLAIVLGLLGVGWTQAPAPPRSSVEETVRSLDEQARIATLNRDIPALERLWSEHFTVNAPGNRVIVGRRAVLDGVVRTGIINYSVFEREIEFVRVEGDFAVIMGAETVRAKADTPSAGLVAGETIQRRVTNIWKKEGDTWRLFWRHANVVPASRPSPVDAGDVPRQNKRVIQRLYDELYAKWNFAVVDEVFSPDFVAHDMPPGMPRGPEGVRQFYAGIRSGLPDVKLTVEDMIADGDKVVVRWRAQATHDGPFLGVPPTRKRVSFGGIAIYRLSNGKAVERWVEVGLLGVAEQLRAAATQ